MLLKKTKLAGIISLVLCTTAVASTTAIVVDSSGEHDFGPYVSAMDTSGTATSTATYTHKYAQQFTYDIGAPWTYAFYTSKKNDYCIYDSDICEMIWGGSKSDRVDDSDGLFVWRRNILNTYNGYNGSYESETTSAVNDTEVAPSNLKESRKITAISGVDQVGYATDSSAKVVRRGFYNDIELKPEFADKQGFSSAHDATNVSVNSVTVPTNSFDKKLIVGQASVQWANADDQDRFTYCFNYPIDDDRYDYDDLYNCPGFDLQASYWDETGNGLAYFSNNSKTTWLNTGGDATFIANAYAINTSGFAVGFSTQQIYSSTSGGRARATLFKPTVTGKDTVSYAMTEITKPKTDSGSDYDDILRDTVAIDITDTVYVKATKTMGPATGTDELQSFITVGNRTYNQPQNRSYVTDFYTYDIKTQETRYPFQANPIKGASSQVSKINNVGLAVGWRDARGETTPTADGAPRFQSAFIYNYENEKSSYLDDLYCQQQIADGNDITYRLSNAISISEPDSAGDVVVVANGFDYKTEANYMNKTGSNPAVFSMTIKADELANLSTTSYCPVKAEEDYERNGAGMGWFVLLPTMLLLFRRFKR
ncbi:MAG: DUF3466 family protein [Moritella sp.]|uniref:DUF3466 family protein n=1 Tax=Moritella sp. TaxID=78556 RepID=UPI0029B5C870|nr:DUF3466 family protein [Moritella sp.]MDX2322479.1 DUF3466 family protein [Moritella sp.]